MNKLIPTFVGSVNRWECDENDHLNVRFYVQKMQQTLEAGLLELKFANRETLPAICNKITVQHMRFGAEARIAAPITGLFGLLSVRSSGFNALIELRNTATHQIIAAFNYDIEHPLPRESNAELSTVALPDYARSRGVQAKPLPYRHLSLAECADFGFITIGKGIIQADECGPEGYLLRCHYMGRSSDSIPNLMMKFTAENEEGLSGEGISGSAVLEYRMSYYSPLRLGDRFEMQSGLLHLGEKIYRMAHLIFNSDSGELILGSESVSINMDLSTRKSVPIAPTQRRIMEPLLLKEIEVNSKI